MSKDNIEVLEGGNTPSITAEALRNMKKNMEQLPEYYKLISQMTRIKYNALIEEGFTEQQAIELCKQLF